MQEKYNVDPILINPIKKRGAAGFSGKSHHFRGQNHPPPISKLVGRSTWGQHSQSLRMLAVCRATLARRADTFDPPLDLDRAPQEWSTNPEAHSPNAKREGHVFKNQQRRVVFLFYRCPFRLFRLEIDEIDGFYWFRLVVYHLPGPPKRPPIPIQVQSTPRRSRDRQEINASLAPEAVAGPYPFERVPPPHMPPVQPRTSPTLGVAYLLKNTTFQLFG